MHRILFTAAVLAFAPVCVHAQAATPKAEAGTDATAKPHKSMNPFGAAIRELTRAAQEQAASEKAAHAPSTARPRDATPKAPASAVPATAPVLADSNQS